MLVGQDRPGDHRRRRDTFGTSGDADAQVTIGRRLTGRLQAAGVRAVAVTSIAGHFCIDAFSAVSPLPVIDMLVEVPYGSGPSEHTDGHIYTRRGGRGFYFADPDGHLLVVMTVQETGS